MRRIKITIGTTGICLYAPYVPALPERAKNLGGKWFGNAWQFDLRDLERVRALCREVWGTDDQDDGDETVRLRCIRGDAEDKGTILLCGVPLARAFGRDGGAKLEPDVIVLSGPGFDSGGSRLNWKTTVGAGTVLELRNLPSGTAAKLRDWCRAGNMRSAFVVEADEASEDERGSRIAALQAERAQIVARLSAIDADLEEVKRKS